MSQTNNMQTPSAKQLTEVFTVRKKTGPYSLIPLEIKCQLMQEFGKEAYPDKKKIKRMSKKFGVSSEKLMCWYQYYQKKLASEKNPKPENKKHKFEKHEISILENAFLASSTLNSQMLDTLRAVLKCPEIYIKRWFSYRNKKLRKIQQNEKLDQTIESSNQSYKSEEIKPPIQVVKTEILPQIKPQPLPFPNFNYFPQSQFFQNNWNFRPPYFPNLHYPPMMFPQPQGSLPMPMNLPMQYAPRNF